MENPKTAVWNCSMSGGIKFFTGRAEDIALSDNRVSKLISVEAAQHFADIRAFTEEAYRVLKPGGKLIVTTFFGVDPREGQEMKDRIPTFKLDVDVVIDLGEYIDMLRHSGFENIKITSVGKHVCRALTRGWNRSIWVGTTGTVNGTELLRAA